MEATGTYWMKLAYALVEADFAVSVVNPIQPKYFSKMRRQHSETDAIDAVMLMEFAQIFKPQLWTPPPAICETLRQYLTYRNQLIDFLGQARSQLHAMKQNPKADADLIQRMEQRKLDLETEIKLFKQRIHDLLLSESQWEQAAGFLLTIKGIGTITAAWLLVATHCFVRCETPEQAASFAGLAPHAKDSGEQQGHRSIGGTGHQQLRNCLYMASTPASRFNPILKPYYDQLVARGKPKKVARCAVARKLIHIAWACVTKQRNFDPDFAKKKQVA
jgi:transposase